MRKLLGFVLVMVFGFGFVACDKNAETPLSDENEEVSGYEDDLSAGDRFYVLSVDRSEVGPEGGVVKIESDEDLIMRWVHLYVDGFEKYTLLYGDEPLYYDEDYVPVFAYPETYPAVYELQDCKITFLAARVVEVDIAASDEQRMFEVVFSGETRTGVRLSPTPVEIYQNKQ